MGITTVWLSIHSLVVEQKDTIGGTLQLNHSNSIIQLGSPGKISEIIVDTAFFTGNQGTLSVLFKSLLFQSKLHT